MGDGAAILYSREAAGLCGDPNDTGTRNATDALIVLQVGVGIGNCLLCLCDVNGSGGVNATDALIVLQFGVGQPVALNCPGC